VTARIDKFRDIVWQPNDNYFRSSGPVRITLSGLDDSGDVVLTADDAEGTPEGEIIVRGKLSLTRSDGTIRGSALRLNTGARTGSLRSAEAHVGMVLLGGSTINMAADGVLTARDARLTTCPRHHAHYLLRAQEIRLSRTGKAVARGVVLEVGGRSILVIPYLEKTFKGKVVNPLPLPGYGKETGLKYRLSSDIKSSSHSALNYDLAVAVKRAPFGALSYEKDLGRPPQDAPPPATRNSALEAPFAETLELFPAAGSSPVDYTQHSTVLFASVGSSQYIYNRVRTDIRISRLPEIGIATYRPGTDTQRRSIDRQLGGQMGAAYYGELTVGHYEENLTDEQTSRLQLRVGGASPTFALLPGITLRAAVDWRGAAYGQGGSYMVLAPQAELVWRAGKQTALSAAAIHRVSSGRTPFLFDRLDTRNELRLRYDGDYSRWGVGLQVAYDADRWRAYDTAVSVVHRLDCMEFGLSYRTRSQGLGLVFNLLPQPSATQKTTEESTP